MGVEALVTMRKPLTRLRTLTPQQEQRLSGLRRIAELLDNAFQVPGTTYRVGLDPILGIIPGLGDLISPLFTIGMLLQARQLAVPKVVQARMIINVAIDTLVGVVPVVGDLFDFAWKANKKNLALLELHAREERRGTPGDYAFVTLMIVLVVILGALPFVLLGWLFSAIGARLF
jgi:Domain of unknown function (DUF4112)